MLYLAYYISMLLGSLAHSGNTLATVLTAKFKYLDIHDVGHR